MKRGLTPKGSDPSAQEAPCCTCRSFSRRSSRCRLRPHRLPPPPPSRPSTSRLRQVRHFRDTAVAPDGARVAWSEKVADGNGEEILGAISVADLPAGKPRRLTAGKDGKPHREWGAAFSPDGRTIAFLSDAAARGQLQIWLAPAAGGPPRQLTRVKGQLDHLLWSADGKSIAFLFVEGSAQETGALVAYKPDSGVVQEEFEEQRIAVADAKTGQVRQVSPADMYVYDYDWSPDGATFAAEAVKGSGTNNYWVAELYRVDAASGQARSILKPSLQIACPRFSPDGKFVAFIHGIMSDEGSTGGDVWSVAIDATSSRNLTPNMKWSARALFWTPTAELLFTADADGGHGVASVDFGQGTIRPLWSAAAVAPGLLDGAPGARLRGDLQLLRKPPEVCAGPVGQWKPVTTRQREGDGVVGRRALAPLAERRRRRPGLAALPARLRPGAHAIRWSSSSTAVPPRCRTPRWPDRWTATLPSQGYFVFLPNPRGSYGFGEAFVQGNVKDFGGGDLRDILSGVDEVVRTAPVDRQARRHHRLELRRLHGDVGGHADQPLRRGRRGRRHRELAELLRAEQDRHVDAPLLRRLRLRRPEGLREVLADRVHQEREDADPRPARRPRLRGARRRRATSSGTRSRRSACRRSSSSTRTRATGSASRRTSSTSSSGPWGGSTSTCEAPSPADRSAQPFFNASLPLNGAPIRAARKHQLNVPAASGRRPATPTIVPVVVPCRKPQNISRRPKTIRRPRPVG